MDLAERYRQAIMGVQPMETSLHIHHGEGPYLITQSGERYLDLATGIAVNAVGYVHPRVVKAVREQLDRHLHLYSGTAYQDVLIDYAEAILAETGPGYRMFFGNSGTEAVEAAIKIARFTTGRPGIVAFRGSFHGRSLGALSLTDSAARYRSPYEPLLPSVYHVDYPAPTRLGLDPEAALERVKGEIRSLFETDIDPSRVAVVVVEPIQGEGGYVLPPDGFLPWLREITAAHGILLATDEVQSGMGRTGRMFAYQHAAITPDIVIMGKALGGGLPLSAIAARADLADAWVPGAHGTTFGGNPLSCASGLATLQVIKDEGLMQAASDLGRDAVKRLGVLSNLHAVRDVRGRGLMVAIEFEGERAGEIAEAAARKALERHMILHMAGLRHEVIRLMPPLNIEKPLFRDALDTLTEIIRTVAGRMPETGTVA